MKVIEKEKVQIFDAFNPFQGQRLKIMNPDGEIINDQWMPDITENRIIEAYKNMLYARIVDLKAVSFQRQGRLYTLPSNFGQEAAAVGSAMAIRRDDWLVPAYRELGAWLTHGLTALDYFLYVGGSEEGCRFGDDVKMAPFSVPISSQLTHAAGLGHAVNYKNGKEVVLTYFGDGGTSEGDFHESMNWAAVFGCPVIFFCNNNGYAISLPRDKQSKVEMLAQKAIGYGMPGIQVDGNDFFAVYKATSE
ncbi:MAG TPA: pyruvate dehydrogenase (acetyl-transferring) E1 component subunit alpha, partial [candidate division Zixibacteria bacterium]|nr:pyruvate dehydrogenase (acetyl-transferring) E1 component subunit alpha [candidate division Zixibacteria bacterium]